MMMMMMVVKTIFNGNDDGGLSCDNVVYKFVGDVDDCRCEDG